MTELIVPSPSLLDIKDSKTITAKSRSNFSSAFIFLSKEKRVAIRRVYAFFRVIDDVVDEEKSIQLKQELIQSWKRELNNTYKGLTIVPLLQELKESIDHFNIPQEYFLKLIEGCEMDITKKRYETFDELYEYCYRVASMVGLVCMKIFEYTSPTSEETAVALGIALQLTNIIRDVGVDLQKGRVYLPQEDLDRFGVTLHDLQQGKMIPNIYKLMEFQYERVLPFYEKGFSEFKQDKKRKLLAARIMGTVYRRILNIIRKKGYPVLGDYRIKLTFFGKIGLLLQALKAHFLR